VDGDGHIIVSLQGRPPLPAAGERDTWMEDVVKPAYDELAAAAEDFGPGEAHCRGDFKAVATGISFGGGQRVGSHALTQTLY
jgi:hypothetical protein